MSEWYACFLKAECICVFSFMCVCKYVYVWFQISYQTLNQCLDALVFIFNVYKFRSFRQRMTTILYIR